MTTKHLALLSAVALAAASRADIGAAGSLSYTQSGSNFTYDITLHNTGTTTIGTLWYAWIPGEDYLTAAPTSTSGPAVWTFLQSHAGGFGYGLRWVAPTGSEIAPGASMSGFKFTTTLTPADLMANTPFHEHQPTGTSFVYEGGPFVGQSLQFVINPVPEPASVFGLTAGFAVVASRLRRRKVAKA